MTSPIRVAVATQNGQLIDLHFGQADAFEVFDIDNEQVVPVGTRVVEHYCQGGYGDEDKREVILRALADCRALFVARVGDGPRKKLEAAGIEAVDGFAHEAVQPSLLSWLRSR